MVIGFSYEDYAGVLLPDVIFLWQKILIIKITIHSSTNPVE
jgi:hypothetical protein